MGNATQVINDLKKLGNPRKAEFVAQYFKTGKGGYGAGDIFLGLTVPLTRTVAFRYKHLSLPDLQKLLVNPIHEVRHAALMILCHQFRRGTASEQKNIYHLYLKNTQYINNWDLIDGSAPTIVGGFLLDYPKERAILYTFAKSKSLWQRRIAILATFTLLKNKQYSDTFAIAELLLHDTHDLIHKAVGWMLREVGKIDQKAEESFLQKYYRVMPRTMLRYAVERFSPDQKRYFLDRKE